MPIHHLLSRQLLVVLGLWAGSATVAVRYLVARWSGRHQPATVASAGHRSDHVVRSIAPISFSAAPVRGLVSVIIPTYNRAPVLRRAIESALSQTYPAIEVVVADDGSSDDTADLVRSLGPRVRYLRQENAGVSAARNFGMRNARGEFVAFLDSDDAWLPWKVKVQVAALAAHPDAGLVWTDMSAIDGSGVVSEERFIRKMYSAYDEVDPASVLNRIGFLASLDPVVPAEHATSTFYKGDLSTHILLGNLIHTSTVLFRRAWCGKTGGFDETYHRTGEDYEFYIRLVSVGTVVFIDAPSTLYRRGVADQLTAPPMLLEIARNNLRAVSTWATPGAIDLPRPVLRRRFSDSFAWVGEAELDAGHRLKAIRELASSLRVRPGLDRRAALLVSCVVPDKMREAMRGAWRSVTTRSSNA
jgi:GT2 family glycosyltransferase